MPDLYASIDLGGTNLKSCFAGTDGKIVAENSIPTESHEGPEAVLERAAELVNALAMQVGQKPEAVGMGVPGLADVKNGITKFLPNLETKWREVPCADTLSPKIGCPVYLLNDVRAATLGELTFGLGRSANTMAFFAIGTGIGGGLAIDGKLHLGPLGAAGELGHQTIIPDGGPLCGCGNRGCLETLASASGLAAAGVRLMLCDMAPKLHDLAAGDASKVTTKLMATAADEDEPVRDAITQAAHYLGIAVSNVIVTVHPDLVVLGGGVAKMGDLLFDAVRETVRDRVRMIPTDDIRIEPSALGEKAGALGCIALAIQGGVG